VLPRKTLEIIGKVFDKAGGMLICSLDGELGSCKDITVLDNIVGGIISTGMTLPGVECGKANVSRKGNVVHSVDEAANGTGAMVFPHDKKKQCYRISGIAAYKCTQLGVLGAFAT
jgi:hypothetical protein